MTHTRPSCSSLINLIALVCLGICPSAFGEDLSLKSYTNSSGETFFAASMGPIEPSNRSNEGVDLVLVVDTSASQTGVYRDTVMASVKTCLESLSPNDRVQIVAADLDTRPMTTDMVAAGSQEAAAAMAMLENEIPLGSTDLKGALKTAAEMLGSKSVASVDARQKAILYFGDGISTSGLKRADQLSSLVSELRNNRIAVTSYAIGPQRDASLLARIANQTGGNLYIDQPMVWADEAQGLSVERAATENTSRGGRVGRTLASWAQAKVVWPEQASLDQNIASLYPAELLPLRSDRDTILIGTTNSSADSIEINATINGQPVNWSSELPGSEETYSYLASLNEQAARDNGVLLTTIGTIGLEETGRGLLAQIEQMTQLAERAATMGDTAGASQISQAVLRRDPGNMRAQIVERFVSDSSSDDRTSNNEIAPIRVAQADSPANSNGISMVRTAQIEVLNPPMVNNRMPTPAGAPQGFMQTEEYFDDGNYPPTEAVIDGRFLNSVDRNSSVYAQLLEKEVQNSVADARDTMREDPEGAIQSLKLMLLNVDRSPELVASVRAGLRDRLETALRQADHALQIKDDLDREREVSIAAARERRMLLDRLEIKREQKRQLLNKFSALMDERRYLEAEEVAIITREHDPDGVEPRVAQLWGRARQSYEFNQMIRDQRDAGFLSAMQSVEQSGIPFSDANPIIYPDAETWLDLTERRKEYASVDLAGRSESEEAINQALSSPLTSAGLDFADTALEEVVDYLRDEYQIEIQLDEQGLDDLGLAADEPITVNLRNISLRSALRLMLKPLELTYVIDDEVLLITSEDEALTRLSVKVYPVADLVLPIQTPQVSGIGGGGGGGQGGGGGGLGGGGGGQGGGGGGGGFGGGGGGGQFSVPDTAVSATSTSATSSVPTVRKLTLSAPKAESVTEQPAASKLALNKTAEEITLPKAGADASAWDAVFRTEQNPSKAVVRDSARRLMAEGRYADVAKLIESALRNNAAQAWMYESLGIALQLEGGDQATVERAVMSAVDFATSADHLLVIADYLKGLGLDKRAVQVCRLAVDHDPMLHESYALALRAAERSKDDDSIAWASTAILSRAWPHEHKAIEEAARYASKALLAKFTAEGNEEGFAELSQQLQKAKQRDCVIHVRWTGEADVDFAVEEPGGTMCSPINPRTTAGGINLGDSSGSVGGEHCETYICPHGFTGDYRVAVRKVWGDVTADTVSVEVVLGEGSENERRESQQFRLEDGKDAVVEFNLADGRLDQPLEEQQIAQAIERQRAVSQAVLSQQIDSLAGDSPTSLRPQEARRRRLALANGNAAVGFQPVIITLPDGTNFQATAVVSADRRYVRVTSVPFFSGVSSVSNFSFSGTPQEEDDADADAG